MLTHTAYAIANTNVFDLNETNTYLEIRIDQLISSYTIISNTPELGHDIIIVPNKSKLITHITALIYSKFSQLFDRSDFPLSRYIISLALQEERPIVILQAIDNHIAPTVLFFHHFDKNHNSCYTIGRQ